MKNKIEKFGILMLCVELNSINIISMLYMIFEQMLLAFDVIQICIRLPICASMWSLLSQYGSMFGVFDTDTSKST